MLESEDARRLQRLWDEVVRVPLPAPSTERSSLQELALYQSWLGSIVVVALAGGGRLSPAHARLLEVRRREGNQALWQAAADLGETGRAQLARLLAVEDLLGSLPTAD